MVADLWQRKSKIRGCLKNSTSIVLQECRNKVSFQRKSSSVVLKYFLNLSKGKQCCLFIGEHFPPFEKCSENINTMPEHFLRKFNLFLTLLENNLSAVMGQPLILPFLLQVEA